MASAERINLTLPAPVASAVAELADQLGLSKSAAVASWLTWHLPVLRAHLERLRASSGAQLASEGCGAPVGAGAAAQAAERGPVGRAGENRAARRRREREARKLGL